MPAPKIDVGHRISNISGETSEWEAIAVKTIAIASPTPPMINIGRRFPVMIASQLLLSRGHWKLLFQIIHQIGGECTRLNSERPDQVLSAQLKFLAL